MHIVLVPGFNPGVYTGAGNNTYFLPGATPTLIDAGAGEPRHLAALEQHAGAGGLAQVLVTHAHPDHADGSGAIAARWPAAVFRKIPWPERDRLQPVDWQPLADGENVAAGDGRLRVIHTPGHAPDHVCLYDEASRTLFSADLVVAGGSVVIPPSRGGSLSDYLDSLRRVQALAPARMLPAHGDEIGDPLAVVEGYLEHRRQRERQIVDALSAGLRQPRAIAARIYDRLDERLAPLAVESVEAHLIKLRDEGRARVDGGGWALC